MHRTRLALGRCMLSASLPIALALALELPWKKDVEH